MSYWEGRLLARVLRTWRRTVKAIYLAADAVANAARLRSLSRHLRAMVSAHYARRRDNRGMMLACAHFGIGLERAAFVAWRGLLLQAKAWFMQGERAFLEHAFRQMRKQSRGVARFGHAWREAAGLDTGKQMRRTFARLLRYAVKVGSMQAALAFWGKAHLRAGFLTWAQASSERVRMLRLLRRSLSHHSLVLLQAVTREWYIAVRHDVMAREAWHRSSLVIAFARLEQHAITLSKLSSVAFSFLSRWGWSCVNRDEAV